jgi:tetratricopeptide (TPR) repeat protein
LLAGKAGDGSALRNDGVTKSMKLFLALLIPLAVLGSESAGQQSEFATGRAYYTEGEFKKAVEHFQLALKVNPNDAESYYWMGMSYQVLADIAFPFAGKYTSKARVYLTRATELAPGRSDYRRELFDFLVDSAGSSRAAARQAADLLRTVPEPDPDYSYMHQRFEYERRGNVSAEARLGRVLLAIPRATYRIAELPVSAFSNQGAAGPGTPVSGDRISTAVGVRAADAGVW